MFSCPSEGRVRLKNPGQGVPAAGKRKPSGRKHNHHLHGKAPKWIRRSNVSTGRWLNLSELNFPPYNEGNHRIHPWGYSEACITIYLQDLLQVLDYLLHVWFTTWISWFICLAHGRCRMNDSFPNAFTVFRAGSSYAALWVWKRTFVMLQGGDCMCKVGDPGFTGYCFVIFLILYYHTKCW
jgi:hypothetical protein